MQCRLVLALILIASAVVELPSCSKSPAEAQQHRGDSPPPQPIGKPQVVKPSPNQPVFNATTFATYFKTPTQQLINATRDKARREWRKDAVVTNVDYHVSTGGDGRVHAWTSVRANSASDGAQRNYMIGDIYDGQIFDFKISDVAASKKKAAVEVIGTVKSDLADATATLKRYGYNKEFDEVSLEFVGKGGKRELPAYRFLGMRDGGMFPLTVNALTGRIMNWRDAYRTPDWSDAEIAAVFAKLRSQQVRGKTEAEMIDNTIAFVGCQETGGIWVYASNECTPF